MTTLELDWSVFIVCFTLTLFLSGFLIYYFVEDLSIPNESNNENQTFIENAKSKLK